MRAPSQRLRSVLAAFLAFSLPVLPAAAQVVRSQAPVVVAPVAGGQAAAGSVVPVSLTAPSLTAGPTLAAPSLAAPAASPRVSAAVPVAAAVPAAVPALPAAAAPSARVIPQAAAAQTAGREAAAPAAPLASLRSVEKAAGKTPAPALGRFFDGGSARGSVNGVTPALAGPSHVSSLSRLQRAAWWKDPAASHAAVSVPLYALRRSQNDPGIGKYTDLGPYYRDVLAKQGVGVMHLLPHFAILGESPYAPVSLDALNEDNVDWAAVPEVQADPALAARLEAPDQARRQTVDYAALRGREGGVAAAAWAAFKREQLGRGTARGRQFQAFLTENDAWLGEYAEFMALAAALGKPALEWTEADLARARRTPGFAERVERHAFTQWHAATQLKEALGTVHAAGGKVIFDIPMFRGKNSVDAWKRPQYFTDLKTRNPGIKNEWINEDWGDLALWNWTRLRAEGYKTALDPFRRWLDRGFDGGRVDALHFAYRFGSGQLASGDEPGDDYVQALAGVFEERGAFPLAEAFEGKAEAAERFGFVTVYNGWKKVSSHDDPRKEGFMGRFMAESSKEGSGKSARFAGYTLGDEWNDPFPVKESVAGGSSWRYRIPLPSDPDYENRARADSRGQMGAWLAARAGDVWRAAEGLWSALAVAADTFVKHVDGTVKIWAASLDWFLEEWGRDTFISLPGLLLTTDRAAEAKENIRQFARQEREGLIPNRIAAVSEYNTVDGSMWFIQAVKRLADSGDAAFAAEMLPVMRRIMARYAEGTGYQRYGRFNRIAMDSTDGLIVSPAQATWMDADPEGRDRPVTPRNGKAVEINALWYANLRFMARLERADGAASAADALDARAEQVKKSFNKRFWFVNEDNKRFWGGTGGALRDAVDGDPHGEAIRPNMLFAVSHGEDLLPPDRQRAVVQAAAKDLLTPYGLRTLSFRDSRYQGRYDTSKPPSEKDQAYHQGTVWPWLMGSFVDALVKVRKGQGWSDERVKAEVRGIMTPLVEFLAASPEGSLPEVFDGGGFDEALRGFNLEDPAGLGPVVSRLARVQNRGGTRSQAWSVGEVLRVLEAHGLLRRP
ncbi:MAG: 4-alpha-glucanotransferase [Elusimicrobia bacterium]|nr:4-alpha-glucanotransferase [Elusimicrobiota bacterium]